MFQNPEQVLLIASVILFFSIFAGKAGYRFGLPALLLFLGVGMKMKLLPVLLIVIVAIV